MYKKVNKLSETHLKVLGLFTKGFNKEYYIREAQSLLNISSRTAQLALNFLENRTVLESVIRGKIKLYKIKKSFIARDYLIMAEIYTKMAFLEKNFFVKDIIEKIMPLTDGIVMIFGSYSKGTQKEDSDLDIFVAGTCNTKKIKEIAKLYNLKINIKNYPLKLFEQKFKKDILIREVMNNHIIIKNMEKIVDIALQ